MSQNRSNKSFLENPSPRYLRNTPEVPDPVEIPFSGGSVPTHLINRSLYSSAPGVFDLEHDCVKSWFDGYACLSKYTFLPGKVIFKSRYLGSRAHAKARKEGRPVYPEFGTPPYVKGSVLSKFMPFTPYDCTDNVTGPIFKFGKEEPHLYTSGDSCYFHKFDPESLETLESYHTYKTFGLNTISKSPELDEDGNFYQIGAGVGLGMESSFKYSFLKGRLDQGPNSIPLSKSYKILNTIPSRWMFGAAPPRSFALTKRFIVMIEMPVVLSLMKFTGTYAKALRAMDWMEWRPEEANRFLIFTKTGQLVREVYSEKAIFCSFIVNAFETEEEEIVMDLTAYPNVDFWGETSLQAFRGRKEDIKIPLDQRPLYLGSIQRFRIPLKEEKVSGPVSPTTIVPNYGADFCAINPKFAGKANKFIYMTAGYMSTPFAPWANGVAKVGVEERKVVALWEGRKGQVPCPPIFIPNGEGEDEESGVIVTLVKNLYSETEKDFLVVIDAKTMEQVGKAEFPQEVKVAGWLGVSCF